MEILLWLVPAALVTLLAAWGAAVAARREETQRLQAEARAEAESGAERRLDGGPAAPLPTGSTSQVPGWDELEGGVSEPRPARRPAETGPRAVAARDDRDDTDDRRGHGGPVRRSA